jgi:transketolase
MEVISKNIRKSIISMVVPGVSHHIGSCLSCVDILATLYFKLLNVDPQKPQDPRRDIFIMSKGHAGAAYFATLAEKGFFNKSLLSSFDIDNGIFPEHVSRIVPGVELSTGSLGHGLPVSCGFAINSKNEHIENRIVVLNSDGEMDEGSNWEAIAFAAHHKLDNLISIIDVNGCQGYGKTTKVLNLSPLSAKFEAFGWDVYEIDGHNFDDIILGYKKAYNSKNNKPKVILAHTIKGKGVKKYEDKPFESHYMGITDEEKKDILKNLDN